MAKKFSGFSTSITPDKTSTSQFIVGYSGQDNAQWTMKALADEIGGGDNFYIIDGSLTDFRTVNHNGYGLKWDLGTNSHFYETSSGSGTYINFRQGGAQRGAILNASSGGAMYFRDSGGVDYYSVSQNGFYLNRNAGFGITAQANQRVTIKGSGLTDGTTALLVEDNDGNDIFKVLDNRTFGLGYNALQITNSVSGNESVRINDRSGAPLLKVGVSSGSAAAINMCNGYYNTFSYTTVGGMVYTNAAGVNSAQDPCSMFTLNSSEVNPKGMLPPRLTTTLRDAINSGTFTTGTTIYNTTDNKLQFYNGTSWTDAGGGDNIYTADGTLESARTVSMDGNNLTFSSASGFPQINSTKFILYPNGNSNATNADIFTLSGRINFNYLGHQGQGLFWNSYNTSITGFGFSFYGGGAFTHNSGFSVIGPSFGPTTGAALNARLGVIGKSATSTTDYAFRVQDSAAADMFSVRDDGAFTLGKGASTILATQVAVGRNAAAGAANAVAIGNNATASNSNSVAIGNSAGATYDSISIGSGASSGSNGIAMGQSSAAVGNGVAIGYDTDAPSSSIGLGANAKGTGANSVTLNANGSAVTPSTANEFGVYMTSSTTPDFRVIGAKGMIPPSITTTVRDAISSPISGSTIYNTTDNKLQFYNGSAWTDASGGDNIYTTDGSILTGVDRNVDLAGTGTLQFTGVLTQGDFRIGSSAIGGRSNWAIRQTGDVIEHFCYQSNHYAGSNSDISAAGYKTGVNYLSVSAQGLEHHKVSVGVGINGTTNDRLVIKGADVTSSKHSVRVLDNDDASMFSIRNDGNFMLGKSAVSSTPNNVVIGGGATDTAASNSFNVIIGKDASITGASNQGCIIIGDGSLGTAGGSIAVGSQAKAKAVNAIAIGQRAQPTGANSITLDASGSGVTAPSTANAFGVYMTSNTTPDFEVKGTTGGNQASFVGQVSVGLKSSATIDGIDWDAGNIQEVTLASSNDDFDPTNEVPGSTYILKLTQPAAGNGTINWEGTSATVNWPGGTAPTLTATNGAVDIITLVCTAANTYYGTSALNFS